MKDERFNAVIIGGGTAGLVTAAATAGLGGRVALIERARMGGDCLNVGCVPSKALIASARLADRIRHADRLGLDATEPSFAFTRVLERMRARRAQIAPHDSQERFEKLGVTVLRGEASFTSPHEVVVEGRRLHARNFVIASGTRPSIPDIPGLREVPFFTNETIFDEFHHRPESMLVLGGGPIGCELAQAFHRLGVRVTIVHRGGRWLPREDAPVSKVIGEVLAADGLEALLHTQVERVALEGDAIVATLVTGESRRTVRVAALLIATGRRPNTESLNLAAAGVACTERGVTVDRRLRTSQPHIFAAGDIAGPYRFTHMADYQARIVARNILVSLPFLQAKVDYSAVPWCTYLDPEVARVGLSEDEAQERGVPYDLYELPLARVDRAVVEDETQGFVRVLTAKGKDRLLGVTLVSAHAGELIQEYALALRCGLGLSKISGTIHAYPTFAEVARQSGDAFQKTRLTPLARKIFARLYARQLRK